VLERLLAGSSPDGVADWRSPQASRLPGRASA
jgi:hypothetical protein